MVPSGEERWEGGRIINNNNNGSVNERPRERAAAPWHHRHKTIYFCKRRKKKNTLKNTPKFPTLNTAFLWEVGGGGGTEWDPLARRGSRGEAVGCLGASRWLQGAPDPRPNRSPGLGFLCLLGFEPPGQSDAPPLSSPVPPIILLPALLLLLVVSIINCDNYAGYSRYLFFPSPPDGSVLFFAPPPPPPGSTLCCVALISPHSASTSSLTRGCRTEPSVPPGCRDPQKAIRAAPNRGGTGGGEGWGGGGTAWVPPSAICFGEGEPQNEHLWVQGRSSPPSPPC